MNSVRRLLAAEYGEIEYGGLPGNHGIFVGRQIEPIQHQMPGLGETSCFSAEFTDLRGYPTQATDRRVPPR
jgi:hypothetical protein